MKLEVCDILIIFFFIFRKIKPNFLLFKPFLLPNHLYEPYFQNIMVHGMSIIESKVDE